MGINLGRLLNGTLTFGNRVIDIGGLEIRAKATNQDVEKYYDDFLEVLKDKGKFFENVKAFENTFQYISSDGKPELIAREPKYPGFFSFSYIFKSPSDYFNPDKRSDDKFFLAGCCKTRTPIHKESVMLDLLDPSSKNLENAEEGREKMKRVTGRIEIPNDRSQSECKATTFHEALHYTIANYQFDSNTLFTNSGVGNSKKERHTIENMIHERVVEILTEDFLQSDKDALFASRWIRYSTEHPAKIVALMGGLLPVGYLVGESFDNPEYIPAIVLPGLTCSWLFRKFKRSKFDYLTREGETPGFSI